MFQIQDSVESIDVQWQGFAKLDADDVLLYFVRTDRTVYGVPRRAFSSSEDANAFYQTARDYWQSAKDGAPAPPPTRSSAWPPPPGR